jgi:hypothetical protein
MPGRLMQRNALWKQPDLPPLKWSSLKYGLTMEDTINGEEEAYSGRDRCEAATG